MAALTSRDSGSVLRCVMQPEIPLDDGGVQRSRLFISDQVEGEVTGVAGPRLARVATTGPALSDGLMEVVLELVVVPLMLDWVVGGLARAVFQ